MSTSPDPADEPVVALVVLRPASGRAITGDSEITAETLPEFAPDPADAEAVVSALADAGFEVGPVVGIAMSVTGPRRRFEDRFGVQLKPADEGGWIAASGTRSLPVDRLPAAVAGRVHAVELEPPAELTGPAP